MGCQVMEVGQWWTVWG